MREKKTRVGDEDPKNRLGIWYSKSTEERDQKDSEPERRTSTSTVLERLKDSLAISTPSSSKASKVLYSLFFSSQETIHWYCSTLYYARWHDMSLEKREKGTISEQGGKKEQHTEK